MKISLKQELTKQWFKNLQDIICKNIEEIENKKIIFVSKKWKRNKKKNEGGGEFKLLENGKVFEKVGVNFSEVYGKFPDGLKENYCVQKITPNFGHQVYQLLCT